MKSPGVLRVGLLGFGTVGTGVYRMLEQNHDAISKRIGFPCSIKRVGVRDIGKVRKYPLPIITDDLVSIIDDPNIDVVVEVMGGLEPAGSLIERALRSGKSVVTANKELIAKEGSRLVTLAKSLGLDLHYEAAAGGGIPLIQPLKHQLAGNDVLSLVGILNGTTNYILTRMSREGADLAPVLAEAQAKGYAEADPTNDVDGFDSAYKLAILGSIVFGRQVPVSGVHREGIRELRARDIVCADLLGYRIKLLGIIEPIGDAVLARVHPTLVPKSHPLASVEDVYNAVWVDGDFVGDVMFVGRGAGGDPTASAIVGDLIDVGRNIGAGGTGSAIPFGEGIQTCSIDKLVSSYYVRISVRDEPLVLGKLATTFGKLGVSLAAMEMRVVDAATRSGEIVFLTHLCQEEYFRIALVTMVKDGLVDRVDCWMRVFE